QGMPEQLQAAVIEQIDMRGLQCSFESGRDIVSKRSNGRNVTNEDLPCRTRRTPVTDVIDECCGDIDPKWQFKRPLRLRLQKHAPIITPNDILKPKLADV